MNRTTIRTLIPSLGFSSGEGAAPSGDRECRRKPLRECRRSVLGTRLLLPCIAVGLALSPSASAQIGGGPFVAGAAGAGDPYFPLDGNGGYDVRHYDLELKYDPTTDLLDGRARIRARAKQNLSSFNLDLVGLIVHSVTVNGQPATFGRDGSELTITPQGGLRRSGTFIVVVDYGGVPQSLEDAGFVHTDDGTLVAGEPHSAASWFPVNDHPTDKASYSFAITVPDGLEAVANGTLERQRTRNGWTTWSWEAKEPMASYLTTATIGEFDLRAYTNGGIRFWDAVDPDLLAPLGSQIETAFALQPEIIQFLESLFGHYPFRSAGAIVDDYAGLSFALENQTRPIYPVDWAFDDPATTEGVFVHEIAHQWFGNSLSVARWKDIWLNEGFAKYAEWLWLEGKRGVPAQETFDRYYFNIPSDDPNSGWYGFWQGVVGDPGPDEIFGLHVYYRGAMTLHQLRLAVGDHTFFAILKRWTQQHSGDNVTTEEFITVAERMSGQELDDLFETWLFSPGRPELPMSLAATASASGSVPPIPHRPHGERR